MSQSLKAATTLGKKDSLLGFALFLLVFDRFWGVVYAHTFFQSPTVIYLSFILLLILFFSVGLKYGFGKLTGFSLAWTPYLLITIIGFIIQFKIQDVSYWIICLIMILIASKSPFNNAVPIKLIFYSGIFCAIGILFEMLFPNIYFSSVDPIFVHNKENFAEVTMEYTGFAGFTYQLDTTARPILMAEMVLLCLRDKLFSRKRISNVIYYLLLVTLIAFVLLAGKRTFSLNAIVLPFLVYYLSKRSSFSKYGAVIAVAIIAYGFFRWFVSNLDVLSDSLFFRRFANSYIEYVAGGDVSSGRSYLSDLAWKAFESSPIFGIGVGKFIAVTNAYTDVHNTYLQTLCEQGIVGFILYLIGLIYAFFYTVKLIRNRNESTGLQYLKFSLAIQLFYILYCFTGNENLGIGQVFYFMAIAIAINAEKQHNIA